MSLRSKRIADTVEALIGAYLSAVGEQAAFLFLKSLGMDIEFHTKIPPERTILIKCEEFINVRSLETIIGYEFKDPLLLMEALTHGSYQIAGTTACYQVDLKAFTPLYLGFCIPVLLYLSQLPFFTKFKGLIIIAKLKNGNYDGRCNFFLRGQSLQGWELEKHKSPNKVHRPH
jgi:hypothetical protein